MLKLFQLVMACLLDKQWLNLSRLDILDSLLDFGCTKRVDLKLLINENDIKLDLEIIEGEALKYISFFFFLILQEIINKYTRQ